jgi:hypothetical protein
MSLPLLTQTYEQEDIARIDVIYADGLTEQFFRANHDDDLDHTFQDKLDRHYRDEFDDSQLDYLVAYDYNGDRLASRTATEFFGEREGF